MKNITYEYYNKFLETLGFEIEEFFVDIWPDFIGPIHKLKQLSDIPPQHPAYDAVIDFKTSLEIPEKTKQTYFIFPTNQIGRLCIDENVCHLYMSNIQFDLTNEFNTFKALQSSPSEEESSLQ